MSTKSKKKNHLKKITVTMHTENKESNSIGQSQGWIGGYMMTRSKAIRHSMKNKARILNEWKESDDFYDDDGGNLPVQIEGSDIHSNDENQSSYQNRNEDVLHDSRKNSKQLNDGKEKTNGFYAEEEKDGFTSNESLISIVVKKNTDTEPDDLSKTKNGEKRPYICSLCPRTYTSSSNLKRHMRVHTGETTGTHRNRHKCHLCKKEYVRTATLRNHFRKKHGDSKEKPFKCPACEESFFSLNACNGHLQKHKNYKPFKCSKCEKGFCREMNLKMHMLNAHVDVKPFTCESCGRSFPHQPQFIQHARSNCLKTFVCDVCDKVSTTKQNLILHKMTHSDVRNFLCKFCGKRFLTGYALKRHMRIHTGEKPFPCDQCPMRFIRRVELNQHMTLHTGVKLYLCEKCGKEFNCTSNLKKHKRLHTGERPYVCDTCGKTFVQLSHLKRHARTHTGIKSYTCVYCGKSFNHPGNLKIHEKTHSDIHTVKQKRVSKEPLSC